ncbi:MAG: hypothetical protein KDN22_03245 [Verrucomicrobiae bacterium]|nr:hypothetical protein [Verrucomicrobiae bacterium]
MSKLNRDWQQRHLREISPLLGLVLGIAAMALPSAGDPGVPPAEVAAALEMLDADSYADRERASHALWLAGVPAEPFLEKALGHPKIEVRARARRVLQLLRFGLDANASPQQWGFIQEFHSSEPEKQATIIFQMLQKGESSLALRLLDGAGSSRPNLLAQLDGQLEQALPAILIKGDLDEARRLIDLLASCGHRLRYAAWFHYVTGTIDDSAARLAALTAPDALTRRRLYYLALARGDTDLAALLAEALDLVEEERGFGMADITPAEFAKQSADTSRDQVELLGFLAAHARLSADDKAFHGHLAGLERVARLSKSELPFCLEAMMINGDIAGAIKSSSSAMEPFRIRARQWKIREALQSLGITAQAPPFSPWIETICNRIKTTTRLSTRQELLKYPYALAELCIQTGEQAEAERICRLTADALLAADRLGFHQAIRFETELGLDALAKEHALKALSIGTPEISIFLGMYGKDNQHARNWFDYLRSIADDHAAAPEERLRLLALLLGKYETGSAARDEITPLITAAFEAKNPLRGTRKSTWATTLAYTASLHGVPLPDGFSLAAEDTDALKPEEAKDTPTLPMATRMLGRANAVLSPYGTGWIVDIGQESPGAEFTCPFSGNKFIIPPLLENTALLRPLTNDRIRALRDTGIAHFAAGQHQEAVAAFSQAVEASGNQASPILLYQLGEAMIASGDTTGGAARQLQARLLAPLTSDRLEFIEYLWEQGKTDEVAEECRFLYLGDQSRISSADGGMFDIVARFLEKSDPLKAADLWEIKLLTALRKQHGSTLADTLESRFRIHHTRAIGYQQFGDLTASLDEVRSAAEMLPADARLAEALAPLLQQNAVQKGAAELLNAVETEARNAASQFPDSTMLQENLARIEAVTRTP